MTAVFTAMISVIQVFKDYKGLLISLLTGVVSKILLNNSLISAFYKMGLPSYYGIISATIIGYFVSFIICLVVLKNRYGINYESVVKNFIDILCASLLMVFVLYLVRFIVPVYSNVRFMNLFIVLVYFIVGATDYFTYTHYTKVINNVLGTGYMKKIFKKNK